MIEPTLNTDHFGRWSPGIRWSEIVGQIEADLDPKDPDTPTVVAELRAAEGMTTSGEVLRAEMEPINRRIAGLAARTAQPVHIARHPDGWGPCPDGCPCSDHEPPEGLAVEVAEVVADTPHTRGWLNRWAQTLKRGSK